MRTSAWKWRCFVAAMAVLSLAAGAWAAQGRKRPAKIGEYDPQAQNVDMFAAMEKGDIEVKLIPKDSTQCNVLIKNKTDRPLNVKLPDSFAGVPALAQMHGGGGGSGRSSSHSGSSSGTQSTGGGMGGGGGGMFNVPPEKVGQLKVATVCLEHGKKEPQASIPYEIKPLESVTSKPGVRELCEMLGSGRLSQRAAQAATWHLNNGMSWQELAAKRVNRAGGISEPYFSAEELQGGMNIAAAATRQYDERQRESAGKSGVVSESER